VTEDQYDDGMAPLPMYGTVRVETSVYTRHEAADFGSAATYSLTGTEEARQILTRDPNRLRAVILCVSAAGAVFLGSKAQAQQPAVKLGYRLPSGVPLEIRNQQEWWVVGDGSNPATVSVLVERWERKS